MNKTTAVPICLRTKTRICANTPTNTTLLLALYCHPNNPVAGTVLLPNQTMTVLRLQSNRPNDRADTPAIQRPIDRLSSECSTYYHYLMLAPHCHQNWHFAALPAAAYLGTTILWFYFIFNWFYFVGIYGQRLHGHMSWDGGFTYKERTASVGI